MRKYRLILSVELCFVFVASLAVAAEDVITRPFEGVRVIHSKSMSPRQVDMWVAEIDMSAPGVSFLVTPSNGDLVGDTTPETTRPSISAQRSAHTFRASWIRLLVTFPRSRNCRSAEGRVA